VADFYCRGNFTPPKEFAIEIWQDLWPSELIRAELQPMYGV